MSSISGDFVKSNEGSYSEGTWPPPLHRDVSREEELQYLFQELSKSPSNPSESRLYRSYSTDSQRLGSDATPLPFGNVFLGKESPAPYLVLSRSIEAIKSELPNANDLDSRNTIYNHLSTISQILEFGYITERLQTLFEAIHINESELNELKTSINSIISEFECLLSPVGTQRSSKLETSPHLVQTTAETVLKNLYPPSPYKKSPSKKNLTISFKPEGPIASPFSDTLNYQVTHEFASNTGSEMDGKALQTDFAYLKEADDTK